MIKKKKRQYKKPDKKEKATIYPYNDNKQFDIVTRRHPKNKKRMGKDSRKQNDQ